MPKIKKSGNILFSGVGGQGILLASEITAYALIECGFDVKKSEVHGMAQRGGSVVAHLRYGEKVYSPLIEPGTADVLVAFETLESVRYLPFLNPGSRVIVNTQQIFPPAVNLGLQQYPIDIFKTLMDKGLEVLDIDAFWIAERLGMVKATNMVLVGALSKFIPVKEKVFLDIIKTRIPERFRYTNVKAFKAGRRAI